MKPIEILEDITKRDIIPLEDIPLEDSVEGDTEISPEINILNAKYITDENGYIYNKEVLDILSVGDIVRIFYKLENYEDENLWTHDASYIKIINIVYKNTNEENIETNEIKNIEDNINDENIEILGEILDIRKNILCNKYPLDIGERIWFKRNNIIEIPIEYQNKSDIPNKTNKLDKLNKSNKPNKSKNIKKKVSNAELFNFYLNKSLKLPVTGPLYTTIYDEFDTETDENDYYSDFESDIENSNNSDEKNNSDCSYSD